MNQEDTRMERERPRTPEQCKEYHQEMASFHNACAQRVDFDLSSLKKWFGHSDEELLELKKFLVLKSTKQDIGPVPTLTPSEKIEEMWVDFLKFPSLYHEYCCDLVELKKIRNDNDGLEVTRPKIIDHVLLRDPVHTYDTFQNTLREYERFFDYPPPEGVWRNPFEPEVAPIRTRPWYYSPTPSVSSSSNTNTNPQNTGGGGTIVMDDNVSESTFNDEEPTNENRTKKRPEKKKTNDDEDDDEIVRWSTQYETGKRVIEKTPETRSKKKLNVGSSSSSEREQTRNTVSFSNEKPRVVPKKKSPKKHKREGKFTLRYESCPKCNAAVGENNHNNRIAVYYNEETGEEDRRGHSGKCKKKVLNR